MKRLLTYLSAIIIMMMVPIGAKAYTFYVEGTFNSWEKTDQLVTSPWEKTMTGAEWYSKCGNKTTCELLIHADTWYIKPASGKGNITVDGDQVDFSSANNASGENGKFTFANDATINYTLHVSWTSDQNNCKVWVTSESVATTTATLSIPGESPITSTRTAAPFHFYIPEGSYTKGDNLTFTVKTEQGSTTTYYGNSTTFAEGPKTYTVSSSSSSNTCTYAVPSNATGIITVSLLENLTELVIAHQTSGGGGGTTTEKSYYLVGNFFNTDDGTNINYNNRYFKFNKQSDGSYMVEIPATVTANTQILCVEGSTTSIYGPGEAAYGLHAATGSAVGWPATDGSVSGNLTKSTTLNLNNNYWALTTRNNDTSAGDDDGLYEVSFTLNSSGVPSNWTIKHVSTKRVVYFLSTATGAVATPLYDKRNDANSAYTNATKGYLHFDASNQYWVLSNIVYKDIIDDTGTYYCGTNLGAHRNNRSRDILPTTNKLVYKGNGNRQFATDKYGNEVSPNEDPIAKNYLKNNEDATYEVQYNPSNGDGDLAKSHWGMRGQIQFLGGTSADDNIKSVSMVGPAIPGTTSGTTWNWASTAGDMTWDVTENCYKLTLTTTAPAGEHFRFVANHAQAKNFYETNTTARIPYNGTATSGTSAATEEDPNDVAYTTSGTTSYTESSYDILFNRPAGEWTVRFYLTYDKDQNKSFYYTITGTENPDPSVVTTTINTAGGLYINKVLVDVAYTGDSSTPLYWKVGGAPTTSDNLVSYTDDENNVSNRKFLLSTPGQLYVGDGTNTSAPVTFDFTYSTSENYVGVEKNGTVSQIVTSKGGKDCVNVFFKKSENNMSIYVWDAYNDNESTKNLTKVWPGQWMSDDRTLTLNGETFYYVSFPTSDLVQKDGKYKIGFILSNAALGSSDTDADKTKTRDYFLEFNATATAVQGVQETMFYALEANVTANKVVPAGSSYEDQEASTYKGSAAQLFSTNTVYFKNDANWTSPIYCHVSKEDGTKLHELKSNGEMMTLVDATNKIYAYTIPTDYQANLKFACSTSETSNQTFTDHGGKMYTYSTSSWDDAPSSFTTLDAASQTVMNTFLETPPVTTVESRVYPNGQDYYRNMPNDYTLMLSPTWQLDGSTETRTATNARPTWDSDSGKTIYLNGGDKIYQTVTGLAAGTYTVQAIVRGGAVPIHLYLNDTEVCSVTLTGDGETGIASINPYGRCEHLENMKVGTNTRNYHKLEGSATVTAGGSLKISIRAEGGADVADVILLRNANTDGNYWTTAPTSEDVTEYDMSDRSKYNAFSFFDRGANLNSIIKANQKTVIGMSEDNEPYLTGAEKGARRHPCNVVTSSDGGNTWHTPMLALTDYASVIVGSEGKYGNSQYVSQHAYGTSFAYTADKFSYDRATSAKMMSTMLPFALTRSQIISMLGDGVKTYTITDVDKTNLKVTFKETTTDLAAHTPFFFRPSVAKDKMALNESVSVVAKSGTSSTSPSSPAQGLLGTYKHISDVGKTYKDQDFIPYFYENNTFVWADNDANAKPFRVIFLLNKGGNNARMLNAIFVDDTTTGIDGITENIQQNAPVYSIDGKLVSSDGDTSRLSKGVYVKAGKKFIIK